MVGRGFIPGNNAFHLPVSATHYKPLATCITDWFPPSSGSIIELCFKSVQFSLSCLHFFGKFS